ncbi:MAG: hypothetical protein AAF127_01065 [Pseudomonadota bacterium]
MNSGLALLCVTLALWVWRAGEFALIGGNAPLIFLATGAGVLALGGYWGGKPWRWSVRFWGLLMLLIGLVRITLTVALTINPSVTVHAVEAQTVLYHGVTAIHLIAGLWLIIRPPQWNWQR